METYILYFCDLSSGYGLFDVQRLIGYLLNEQHAVRSIDYVKNEDGSSNVSTVEVRLRTRECFNKLLDEGTITTVCENQFHFIRVTDTSPKPKPKQDDDGDDSFGLFDRRIDTSSKLSAMLFEIESKDEVYYRPTKKLIRKHEVCEDSLTLPKSIYRALRECRAVLQVKNEFQTRVEVIEDDKNFKLIFKGPRNEVTEVKSRVSDIIQDLKTRVVPDLGYVKKYLDEILLNEKSTPAKEDDVRKIIQAEFEKKSVCASLQLLDDQVCLLYIKQSEMIRARKTLKEMVKQQTIHMNDGYNELVNSVKWKRFIENLCSSCYFRVFIDEQFPNIVAVGLNHAFDENFRQVNEYVKSNAVTTSSLKQCYVIVQYFQTYKDAFASESKRVLDKVDLEWKLDQNKDEAAIVMTGKTQDVEKASKWFQQMIANIDIALHEIKDPDVSEYFRSEKGKEDVKAIEGKHRCIAIVDPAEWQTRATRNSSKQQTAQKELNISLPHQPNASVAIEAKTCLNSLRISLKSGDLLVSKCNAIVNSTNNFQLTSQVGKLIVERGGKTIANECAKHPIKSSACYRVTSAGKLPNRYIIHVNTPKDANQLVVVLGEVLKVAEELKLESIGFPAIGSGGIGLASNDVAKCMRKAFAAFSQSNPMYLRDIEVWVFQKKMLPNFQKHLLEEHQIAPNTDQQQSFFERLKELKDETSAPDSVLSKAESNVSQDSVSILLCSEKPENVFEARRSIDKMVENLTFTKTIENEVLRELAPSEDFELLAISRKYKVTIKRTGAQKFDDALTLVISGLEHNVLKAYNACMDLIHELKNALVCFKFVVWKYKDKSGMMKDFPLRASNEIEQAYKHNSSGSLKLEIFINNEKQLFEVDFRKMEKKCLADKENTKVERCALSDDTIPETWNDMGGQAWKKVEVKQGSTEYMTVMQKFNSTTRLKLNVVRLERIQNPTLYKQFQAQKKKVADRMLKSGSKRPLALQLFHGTSGDVCLNIISDGFDRSHAGKNENEELAAILHCFYNKGRSSVTDIQQKLLLTSKQMSTEKDNNKTLATLYGRGVYFANTSNYSSRYAQADAQKQKRMFLAEVVTGEFCQGNESMNTAPKQANGSPYDSLVDNLANPSMYVVFKDASVYPSYMLTFT